MDKWIPVTDRVPEWAGRAYLATVENKFGQRRVIMVFTGYGHYKEPFWHSQDKECDVEHGIWKVIAWRELPKSYGGNRGRIHKD